MCSSAETQGWLNLRVEASFNWQRVAPYWRMLVLHKAMIDSRGDNAKTLAFQTTLCMGSLDMINLVRRISDKVVDRHWSPCAITQV